MKIKICPLCVAVSGIWLMAQIGIYLGLLKSSNWILVIALAMGGTVVGIAYQKQSLYWKSIVIAISMPLSYFLVTHINQLTIISEIIILFIFSYLFFWKLEPADKSNVRDIKEKMKDCC